MPLHLHPYSGPANFPAMLTLARACQAHTLHVIDLPYRLSSWALDCPDNIGQWVDEMGNLLAWAVLQAPFWTVDMVLPPDLDHVLLPAILDWVDERAVACRGTPFGQPSWYANVFADQQERCQVLEQHGYTDQANVGEGSWSKVWMERDPMLPVPYYPLPKGFSLRQLAGESEVEAYVMLHQATFMTKNMTGEWRQRTLKQPAYLPDLDVVAVAPGGRLAAFCIGWLSQNVDGELIAQVEPLGCHADFRSYALGRLALCEVLRRLQAHNPQKIYVETDKFRSTAFRLYESLGFKVVREILVYRKDFNNREGK